MEYFSEIYGQAYMAVAAVLEQAVTSPVTRQDIARIVGEHTSDEEALYITDRLLSGQWPLLTQVEDGLYRGVTAGTAGVPLTSLQRSWLAAMLADRRCAAFLSDEQQAEIIDALDTQPLCSGDYIESVGSCSDGDRFDDPGYRERLGVILQAIEQKKIICISYTGGKGVAVKGDFLPCRLEYSAKDDKLRLHAVRIRYGKVIFLATINLGRIDCIRDSRERYDGEVDIDEMRRKGICSEPAVVEITDLRNALERFMVQFSSYEKRTRYIEEEDKYICSIYYDRGDETELLIRLLSFGPVIRLLSPTPLVERIRSRVSRQWELMK